MAQFYKTLRAFGQELFVCKIDDVTLIANKPDVEGTSTITLDKSDFFEETISKNNTEEITEAEFKQAVGNIQGDIKNFMELLNKDD